MRLLPARQNKFSIEEFCGGRTPRTGLASEYAFQPIYAVMPPEIINCHHPLGWARSPGIPTAPTYAVHGKSLCFSITCRVLPIPVGFRLGMTEYSWWAVNVATSDIKCAAEKVRRRTYTVPVDVLPNFDAQRLGAQHLYDPESIKTAGR